MLITGDIRVGNLTTGSSENYESLMFVAMMDLVEDFEGVMASEPPETMLLDACHIKELNMSFNSDVISSVIVATVEEACRTCKINARTSIACVPSLHQRM